MVPAEHKEGIGKDDFVAEEEQDAFAAKMTAIDVIAQKEIPLVSRRPAHLE